MDTKEKILDVSRRLYASYGYEGTTMTMIATEVGIRKPSLYSHYAGKEQIFKDVLDREITDYIDFLHAFLRADHPTVKEKLYKLFLGHTQDDETSIEFYYRFIKYQPMGLEEYIMDSFEEMEKETRKAFEKIIDHGKKQGELDDNLSNKQIYRTYFLLIDGLSTMPPSLKNGSDDKGILDIWEIFYRGIEKRE